MAARRRRQPLWRRLLLAPLALALIGGCSESDAPDDDLTAIHAPEIVRVVPAPEALAGAHLPTLDPSAMNDAEIRKALTDGPRCDFRYTSTGRPVLAMHMQPDGAALDAVVKLNGHLVPLEAARLETGADPAGRLLLAGGPVRMMVEPDTGEPATTRARSQGREANLIFEVGPKLRVGYRGYLVCTSVPPTKVTTPNSSSSMRLRSSTVGSAV